MIDFALIVFIFTATSMYQFLSYLNFHKMQDVPGVCSAGHIYSFTYTCTHAHIPTHPQPPYYCVLEHYPRKTVYANN